MASKKMTAQAAMKNEKYLSAVFSILKRREGIAPSNFKAHFTDTELQLISEILAAKQENKRLISTQLATKLGVTRSAVSQIVNRLEARGIAKRVPDEVDRKIAYIELTEETLAAYQQDVQTYGAFIGKVVAEFGEEKFEHMCAQLEEFFGLIQKEKSSK